MNPVAPSPLNSAIRTGLARGWIEFRHSLISVEEWVFNVLIIGVILVVLCFLRHTTISGTSLPLASLALPGVVGMWIAFNALGAASAIAFEREDGTLLRAKAIPFGVVGYVAGQAVRIPLNTLVGLLLLFIPGWFLFDGLAGRGVLGWLTLLWVLVLGLLATLPVGLILGTLANNPRAISGWVLLVNAGLVAISGNFYPLSALPNWVHPIAEVFPFYWLGLGVRSALLPDSAVAVELGGSWRHLATAAVLGAWAVGGLVLAPLALRRMTRGVTGASVEMGRRRAAQRIG